MEPNHDPNQGNKGASSPFEQNKGRFGRLPPEELSIIARKGGLARSERKTLSSQLNPIKTGKATSALSISQCDECPLRRECDFYSPNSACQVELNIRRNIARQIKAFTGNSPQDMLLELLRIYKQLDDASEKEPSFHKTIQLLYVLIVIYKLKFGEDSFP